MLGLYASTDSLTREVFLCHYKNASSELQILRISNVNKWYFERVVFPGEMLLFEAPEEAVLEIHSCAKVTAILADTISCSSLRVHEELYPLEN